MRSESMGYKLKFKLYDSKKGQIVSYINCSIAIADGTIQSFDKHGDLEGTAENTHLIPIQYTNKNDIDGKEIYQNFIVERKAGDIEDEEIIGVVESFECAWWIVNHKEQRAVPLFSETAVDRIIGTVYQNQDLKELVM
jgi:hypothetical protein